jgi:hypothetical protein
MRMALLGATALALIGGAASAAPLTLTGNYLNIGISERGTFGSNGNTAPGLQHDSTGTQNFGVNDYLTPGTPHDGFGLSSTQYPWIGSSSNSNNNYGFGGSQEAFGVAAPTPLAGPAALGYSLAATWSGTGLGMNITNNYFFNLNDERVRIQTVLTATEDLTNVLFGRSVDPDPDVNTSGNFATRNVRGDALTAPEQLVSSAGQDTGLTLALLNDPNNPYLVNTGISDDGGVGCCDIDDPANVLVGYGPDHPSFNIGDFGLQMAWDLGDFVQGQVKTVEYYYVFGDRQDTISEPTATPEPASLALLGLGLGALAVARRRRA